MTIKGLHIVYEDDCLMAVAKPSGLVVHSDGRTEENSLADWLVRERPEIVGVGETVVTRTSNNQAIERHGIVHRLDRDTSGVILVAKTQECFLALKGQFQERTIRKVYKAFLWGVPKEREGMIDRPIGKSRSDFRKYSAHDKTTGKIREAQTSYKVVKDNGEYAYIEVYPKTGRTHQIRVHMAWLNHPVVCDMLYAPKRPCSLGFGRLALHAHSIEFIHPNSKINMRVEAKLPDDFERALDLLDN